MSAPRLRAEPRQGEGERLEDWLAGYRPEPGTPDLLLDPAGAPRPGWRDLLGRLASLEPGEIDRRFAAADRHIRDTGISYRVYGQASDLAWPLGSLPLVLDGAAWRAIAAGVAQRAELMERVLRDLYGEGALVRDGLVPAALVAGAPEFLRPLHGVRPPGGRHLHLYAADLGLGPDGRWRVLADRTQAPSGAGYSLTNRLVLARAFPDIYGGMNVERLAPFFQAFRAGLVAACARSDPRICILTPGPYSQTYVEQAYLARYLGFLLVEGEDLMVRDGQLHVRTVAGLKRADALWRRVDSSFVDPLALDPSSRLGVPGLVDALGGGALVVGNMPGSGLVEAPALAAVLPALCRHLLGADPLLPGLETWWCGDPAGRRAARERAGELVLGPAYGPAPAGPDGAPGPGALEDRPGDWVAREPVRLGTAPVWAGDRLVPRPVVLRVFAAWTPEGWRVMPGGFCRTAREPGADPLAMGTGVESSDVWVLADGPVGTATLLPRSDEVRVRRVAGHLPSRAADNLFWLGRYLERAEAAIRLVRCLLVGNETVDPADRGTARRIRALLGDWTDLEEIDAMTSAAIARAVLTGAGHRGSAARHAASARQAASSVRERLSTDTWHGLTELAAALEARDLPEPGEADLLATAEAALGILAQLAGLAGENMNRAAGWRFVDMGRRVERAINTCTFARTFADADATADDLDALLELVDSQITYGARYILGVSLGPVRDMALLDPFNPRSVAFQLDAITAHLGSLPALKQDGIPERQRRLAIGLSAGLATMDPVEFDAAAVLAFEDELELLADAVAARYFPGGPDAVRAETLSGLA